MHIDCQIHLYIYDNLYGNIAWLQDIKQTTKKLYLPGPDKEVIQDLQKVKAALHLSQHYWWIEVKSKPKLEVKRMEEKFMIGCNHVN